MIGWASFQKGFLTDAGTLGKFQSALDVRKPANVPLWAPYLTVLSSLSGRAASNYSAKQYILQSEFNFDFLKTLSF